MKPLEPTFPGKVPGFRITNIWAFTCIDSDDTEGVIGAMTIQGWIPLVGADMARVESYRGIAQQIATATGKTIRLSRFAVREEVEELKP